MVDHFDIYRAQADVYDRLVEREDCDGNLRRLLERIARPDGADILELGAGTGRLTRWLAESARSVRAFDASEAMLEVARQRSAELGQTNCTFERGEHGAVPIDAKSADIALAGWSFGHEISRRPDDWREVVGGYLDRMEAALRSGGRLIVIETLGTGYEMPTPPTPGLATFYAWLEGERGFAREWARTDYLFSTHEEAVELIGFFFGEELAARVAASGERRVAECTGLWWREV